MPESNKPFVITDRRKFTKEGELRPDAAPAAEPATPTVAAPPFEPAAVAPPPPDHESADSTLYDEEQLPAPTAEQIERSRIAYEQTADRIDTAIRAADPGGDHPPPMNFDQLVQSVYLTAIMQLGGATPEGEKPRVDILGARQSIDMLSVLAEKTTGNLADGEIRLLDSALFELRMAFLEVTQAIARSAAAKGASPSSKPGLVL